MARFDYRREYKEMSLEDLKEQLDLWTTRLLAATSCGGGDSELKRVSYIKSLIEKKSAAVAL